MTGKFFLQTNGDVTVQQMIVNFYGRWYNFHETAANFMGGDVIVANCTAAAFVENENLPFLAPFFRIRGTDGHKLLICIYLINNTLKCKIIATEILMFQYILIIFVNCGLLWQLLRRTVSKCNIILKASMFIFLLQINTYWYLFWTFDINTYWYLFERFRKLQFFSSHVLPPMAQVG